MQGTKNIKHMLFSVFPLNAAVKTIPILEHHWHCSGSHYFFQGSDLWNFVRKERFHLQSNFDTQMPLTHRFSYFVNVLLDPPGGHESQYMSQGRWCLSPNQLFWSPLWTKTATCFRMPCYHRWHPKVNQLSPASTDSFWTGGLMSRSEDQSRAELELTGFQMTWQPEVPQSIWWAPSSPHTKKTVIPCFLLLLWI